MYYIHHVFLPIINAALMSFVESCNNHSLSTEHNWLKLYSQVVLVFVVVMTLWMYSRRQKKFTQCKRCTVACVAYLQRATTVLSSTHGGCLRKQGVTLWSGFQCKLLTKLCNNVLHKCEQHLCSVRTSNIARPYFTTVYTVLRLRYVNFFLTSIVP